jgi:stage V sporulation protein G
MEITEVRIIKKDDLSKKLKAFANVTFDGCFVVRDMKVVEGTKGLFVAMPSRRVKVDCPRCHYKNSSGGRYCSHCGGELPPHQKEEPREGKYSDHKDIAHPITLEFREKLQKAILDAYAKELSQRPAEPGGVSKPEVKRGSEERPSMSSHDEED